MVAQQPPLEPRVQLAAALIDLQKECLRAVQSILSGDPAAAQLAATSLPESITSVVRIEPTPALPAVSAMSGSPEILVRDAVDGFVRWTDETWGANTLRTYKGRLKRFVERFGSRPLRSLETGDLHEYIDNECSFTLEGREYAPDSKRLNIVTLQRFQAWAVGSGHLPHPIIERVDMPQSQLRHHEFTPVYKQQLLEHATPEFRLAFRAMCAAGIRPNELTGARVGDIDWAAETLTVKAAKPGRRNTRSQVQSRVIKVDVELRDVLREAVGGRSAGFVFLRSSRSPWTTHDLSRAYRNARVRAGLSKGPRLMDAVHDHAIKLCRKEGAYVVAETRGLSTLRLAKRYEEVTTTSRVVEEEVFSF